MLLTNSYIIKTANITKTSVYHLSLRAVQGFADKDWMQGDSVPTEHSLSSWEQQITSGVFSSRRAGEHRKEYSLEPSLKVVPSFLPHFIGWRELYRQIHTKQGSTSHTQWKGVADLHTKQHGYCQQCRIWTVYHFGFLTVDREDGRLKCLSSTADEKSGTHWARLKINGVVRGLV